MSQHVWRLYLVAKSLRQCFRNRVKFDPIYAF